MNEILLDKESESAVEREQDLRIETIRALSVKGKLELIKQENEITETMLDDLIYESGVSLSTIEYYQGY
jgi:hypothetical protein